MGKGRSAAGRGRRLSTSSELVITSCRLPFKMSYWLADSPAHTAIWSEICDLATKWKSATWYVFRCCCCSLWLAWFVDGKLPLRIDESWFFVSQLIRVQDLADFSSFIVSRCCCCGDRDNFCRSQAEPFSLTWKKASNWLQLSRECDEIDPKVLHIPLARRHTKSIDKEKLFFFLHNFPRFVDSRKSFPICITFKPQNKRGRARKSTSAVCTMPPTALFDQRRSFEKNKKFFPANTQFSLFGSLPWKSNFSCRLFSLVRLPRCQ